MSDTIPLLQMKPELLRVALADPRIKELKREGAALLAAALATTRGQEARSEEARA